MIQVDLWNTETKEDIQLSIGAFKEGRYPYKFWRNDELLREGEFFSVNPLPTLEIGYLILTSVRDSLE